MLSSFHQLASATCLSMESTWTSPQTIASTRLPIDIFSRLAITPRSWIFPSDVARSCRTHQSPPVRTSTSSPPRLWWNSAFCPAFRWM